MAELLTPAIKSVKENFLQCSICMEQYTDPRILHCVHSFCFKCIKQHVGTNSIIKCPMCNQKMQKPISGISGLKSNFFIQGLIDQFKAMTPIGKVKLSTIASEECTSCDSGLQTNALCDGCESNICEHCIELHQKIAVLKRHKITLFTEMKQFKVDQQMKDIQQKLSGIEDLSLHEKTFQLKHKIEAFEKEEKETLKQIDNRKEIFMAHVSAFVSKLKDDVMENTKQRMGNLREMLQSYQSNVDSFTALKEQHQVLKDVELDNKSTACEQFIQQLEQFKQQLLRLPLEYIPAHIENKSFVDSVSEQDEYQSCCRRFVGFLKPINSRHWRCVEINPDHMTKSMENYAIHCVHAALDKYGVCPLSEDTYHNICDFICDMFTKRYSRNKWSFVASGKKDTNCSVNGNISTVIIDDYEIIFLEHV